MWSTDYGKVTPHSSRKVLCPPLWSIHFFKLSVFLRISSLWHLWHWGLPSLCNLFVCKFNCGVGSIPHFHSATYCFTEMLSLVQWVSYCLRKIFLNDCFLVSVTILLILLVYPSQHQNGWNFKPFTCVFQV